MPLFARTFAALSERSRSALRHECLASVGSGAFLAIFSISLVVLETILDADVIWQALLAVMFFGSSLFSPLVPWFGNFFSMRNLVILPNLLVGTLLVGIAFDPSSAAVFTWIMGGCFFLRVFPRVGEMNMYRVFYPLTERTRAVSILRAIAGLTMLLTTLVSLFWFPKFPEWYYWLYMLVGIGLLTAASSYYQIPKFPDEDKRTEPHRTVWPHVAFWRGTKTFFSDGSFVWYQFAFAVAGIANHLSLAFIPEVLNEDIAASKFEVTLITAVLPALMMVISAPFWGRWMRGKSPMTARGIFNVLQTAAYFCYAFGGATGSIAWFYAGTILHATSSGGGLINWLTGSLHFATEDRVSLYNTIHVGLTGLRGLTGPVIGYLLFIEKETIAGVTITGAGWGWAVFYLSAGLSAAGMLMMFLLAGFDTGAKEDVEPASDANGE